MAHGVSGGYSHPRVAELKKQIATVFAPATIGNVGPGFDVLGLAVEGIGDTVTVELTSEPSRIMVPASCVQSAVGIAAGRRPRTTPGRRP